MTPADLLAEALARLCFIPCPCCEGEMECHAECTFAEDCPEESFTQKSARASLASYRSAPPVDIERCVMAALEAWYGEGLTRNERQTISMRETMFRVVEAVLREVRVIE